MKNMSRRGFVKDMATAGAGLALTSFSAGAGKAHAEPDGKPNILLIFTDQHRLSAVGAYGQTVCRTPHIDRLASEGVRFENVYTTCPVCSPARGTIMTGQFPHRHGITTNIHQLGCCIHELEDRPTLLSRRLEAAGYSLGYSGKWHLGSKVSKAFGGTTNYPFLPKDVGFEGQNFPGHGGGGFKYPEYREYLAKSGYKHVVKPWSEPTKKIWPMGELEGPLESTVPYFLAENTISLIDSFKSRGAPFFIWHNFWGPHGPFCATKDYIDSYRDIEIPEWPNFHWPSRAIGGPHHVKIHPDHESLDWEDWAMSLRYYYAFTSLIDDQIGRMIAHLEETGQLENTIIIFTSDHGQTLGSHGGLTDKGWHHFEETHRIPLIVRFPHRAHAGKVLSELVSLSDIYPTVLDMAGEAWEEKNIDGASLLPLINGKADNWRDRVVTEFGGVNDLATTMRTLRWKNLKYGFNVTNEDELYDLETDPYEMTNQIDHPDYQDALRELRQRMTEWMRTSRDGALRMFRTLMRYQKR